MVIQYNANYIDIPHRANSRSQHRSSASLHLECDVGATMTTFLKPGRLLSEVHVRLEALLD